VFNEKAEEEIFCGIERLYQTTSFLAWFATALLTKDDPVNATDVLR